MGRATFVLVLVSLAIVLQVANAGTVTYTVSTNANNFPYNSDGRFLTISANTGSANANTITISCSGCVLGSNTAVFPVGATTPTGGPISIRVTAYPGPATLSFAFSSTSSDFNAIAPLDITGITQSAFTIDRIPASTPVGQLSQANRFRVYPATAPYNSWVAVKLTASDFTFIPETLNFTSTTPQFVRFTATSTAAASVSFSLSGPAAYAYNTPNAVSVNIVPLNFAVSTSTSPIVYGKPFLLTVGENSGVVLPWTGYTSIGGLTVTPSSNNATFFPASVTFNPISSPYLTTAQFSVTPKAIGDLNITFTYTGLDATVTPARWNLINSQIISTVQPLSFSWSNPPAATAGAPYIGAWSAPYYMTLSDYTVNSVSVTPVTDNNVLTFDPATLTFDSSTKVVSFRYKATKALTGAINVYYAVSGTDALNVVNGTTPFTDANFLVQPAATVTVPTGTISSTQTLFVTIPAVPISDLTVTPTVTPAGVFTLSAPKLTFGPGKPLAQAITFTMPASQTAGSASVSWALSGTDVDSFTITSTTTALSQTPDYQIIVPTVTATLVAGVKTGPFTAYIKQIPAGTINVALSVVSAVGIPTPFVISPSTLTFNPTTTAVSFWVTASTTSATFVPVVYTIDTTTSPGSLYSISGATSFRSSARDTVTAKFSPNLLAGLTLQRGQPQVVSVYLDSRYPTQSGLSFSFNAYGATFSPNPLVIPAGGVAGQVTVTSTNTRSGTAEAVTISVSGDPYFTTSTFAGASITTAGVTMSIIAPTNPAFTFGQTSPDYTIFLSSPAVNGVTVTPASPVAADGVALFTFNPANVTFNKGDQVKTFTITAAKAYALSAASPITFTVTGTDAALYAAPAALTLAATTLATQAFMFDGLTATVPGTATVLQTIKGTVTLPASTPNGVILTPQSNGVTFNPSSFVFANTTRQIAFTATFNNVTTYGTASTPVPIVFSVSGTDAALWQIPATITVQVVAAGLPTVLALASAYSTKVGVWSNILLLDATFPDVGGETVTYALTASDSSVSFTQNSFTVQPQNMYGERSFRIKGTKTGSFVVTITASGAAQGAAFAVVSYVVTFTKYQIAWPVIPVGLSVVAGTTKESTFSISIRGQPFAPSWILVTPAASGLTFNPPSFNLSTASDVVYFTISANKFNSQPEYVSYSVSGPDFDANYYDLSDMPTPPASVAITARAFTYSISNSGKVYAADLTNPTQFTVTSTAPVVSALTVTPNAPYIVFTPKSVTLSAGQTTAVFNTTIDTSSNVQLANTYSSKVDVALSGTDLKYFDLPTYRAAVQTITLQQRTLTVELPFATVNYGDAATANIRVDVPVAQSLTVTPVATDGVVVTPASITLVPGKSSGSFAISFTGPIPSDKYYFDVAVSGPDASTTVQAATTSRSITVNYGAVHFANPDTVNFGQQSAPWVMTLSRPAVNGMTVTPVANGNNIVFTPASWVFVAGQTRASITFTIITDVNGATPTGTKTYSVSMQTSGPDAVLFASLDSTTATISAKAQGYIAVAAPTDNVFVGQPFTVAVNYPNIAGGVYAIEKETLTITPMAKGITFNPASAQISASSPKVGFTAVVNSIAGVAALNVFALTTVTIPISVVVSGSTHDSLYNTPLSTSVTVARSRIVANGPASVSAYNMDTLGPYKISFADSQLVPESVTVNIITSSGLTASPSSVTLSADSHHAFYTLAVSNVNGGNEWVRFQIATASDLYYLTVDSDLTPSSTRQSAVAVSALTVSLSSPSTALSVNGDAYYTLTLNRATVNGLTVNFDSEGVTVDPSAVVFTPGQTTANVKVTGKSVGNTYLHLSLAGTDAAQYKLSSAVLTFQVAGLAVAATVNNFWAHEVVTNNYLDVSVPVPNGLTITPSATGVQFTPSQLTFGAGASREYFTYTSSVEGPVYVTWTLDGTDAALVAPPAPSMLKRTKGLVTASTFSPMAIGKMGTFTVQVDKLPSDSSEVVVTPKCDAYEFNPSTFKFTQATKSIKVSYTTKKVGSFILSYSVADADLLHYTLPAPTTVAVSQVTPTFASALSAITYGTTTKSQLCIGTKLDVQITPDANGLITFTPATMDFNQADSNGCVAFTYTAGCSGTGAATTVNVDFKMAGADVNSVQNPGVKSVTVSAAAITVPSGAGVDLVVGVPQTFAVSINAQPSDSITLNLVNRGGLTVSPSSLKFDANTNRAVFTATATSTGTLVLDYVLDPSTTACASVSFTSASFNGKTNVITTNLPATTVYAGKTYGPYIASVANAQADLKVKPTADNVTFTPEEWDFQAGAGAVTYWFTASAVDPSADITFALSGADANQFSLDATTLNVVANQIDLSQLKVPSATVAQLYPGQKTMDITVPLVAPIDIDGSVKVTLSAPNVEFNPSELTYSKDVSSLATSVKVSTDSTFSGASSITATLSGDLAGIFTATTATIFLGTTANTLGVNPASTIGVLAGSVNYGVYELQLKSPLATDLQVTPIATGVVFNSTTIPAGRTQAYFTVVSAAVPVTTATITYVLSGDDAAAVVPSTSNTITVYAKNIFKPTYPTATTPQIIGEKKTYSIRLQAPPSDSLSIKVWGAGLTITPSTLTFGSSDIVMNFTLECDGTTGSTVSIQYEVSGDSAGEFTTLSSDSIVVSFYNLAPVSFPTVYAGIQSTSFAVTWKDARFPADDVEIVPSGFGLIFNPAQATLTSTSRVVTFQVTASVAANVAVYFTPSGSVVNALSATLNVKNRTLSAPTDFGTNYHGAKSTSVAVSVDYLPVGSGSLTVTPTLAGVTFNPASVTFTSSSQVYGLFSFTGTVISSGSVVWVLSGSDAIYYKQPAATAVTIKARNLDVVSPVGTVKAGQQFYVDIHTPQAPTSALTITPYGAFTYDKTSYTIAANQNNVRLTVTAPSNVGSFVLSFNVGGDEAQYYAASASTVTVAVDKYYITGIDKVASSSTNAIQGLSYRAFALQLDAVANQPIVLIPSHPYVTFTPPVITIPAGVQTVYANFTAIEAPSIVSITWAVSGALANAVGFGSAASPVANPASVALSVTTYSLTVDTIPSSIVVGLSSPLLTVRADPAPIASVTLTPYVNGIANVTFSPPAITLGPGAPTATFTLASTAVVASSSVLFSVSGPGAYLYPSSLSAAFAVKARNFLNSAGTALPTVYSTLPPAALSSVYPGHVSTAVTLSVDVAPQTSVTITFSNPTGVLAFSPSSITFTPSYTTASFTYTANKASSTELVYYSVSGPDAQYYLQPMHSTVATNLIIVTAANPAPAGLAHDRPYLMPISISSPCTTSFSVSVQAAGFTFSPNPVWFQPGVYQNNTWVTTVGNGALKSPVTFTYGGNDAGWFSTTTTPAITLASILESYSFSGTLFSTKLDIGFPYTVIASLSRPSKTDVSFSCVSSRVQFSQATFTIPAGLVSVAVNATPTTLGSGSVECFASGVDANVYSGATISSKFEVAARLLTRSLVSSPETTTIGGWTKFFDYSLAYGAAGDATAATSTFGAPTPNYFNVTFLVSPAGAAVIDPPALQVAYPATSFAFRVSPKILGSVTVSLVLSGPDANLYNPNLIADQLTVRVVSNKRSFNIMPSTTALGTAPVGQTVLQPVLDRVMNALDSSTISSTWTGLQLYVGVESRPITVSVGAIATNVALVPSGQGLTFNPSVLRFTGTYESLTFTVTADHAMNSRSFIHFAVVGDQANLFNIPTPIQVTTHHNFDVPEFPALTIGQPVTLTMTLTSNFSSPVVVTPVHGSILGTSPVDTSGFVFIPDTWIFTPDSPSVEFQVIAISSSVSAPFRFRWREVYQPVGEEIAWPFPAGNTNINVVKNAFIITYPHLQIGQTGTVTVTTNVPPLSDVVLTFIGNNLNFNPHWVQISAGSTTGTTQVSPVHADYKDSQNIPFTVQYAVTGANAADFTTPAQSFLAVTRGSAPLAESLMLNSASTSVVSALVLIAALLALLF